MECWRLEKAAPVFFMYENRRSLLIELAVTQQQKVRKEIMVFAPLALGDGIP